MEKASDDTQILVWTDYVDWKTMPWVIQLPISSSDRLDVVG